jgi:hypothetical protein
MILISRSTAAVTTIGVRENPSRTSSSQIDHPHQLGYKPKYNILTFYTPLRESERSTLLEVNDCVHWPAKF